jgi:hypothetical protein
MITLAAYKPMCNRLKAHLSKLYSLSPQQLEEIVCEIDTEITEIEPSVI